MSAFWRLGLLGGPLVGSSPSPAMHMSALAACGLKGAYTPLEVQPASLEGSLAALFELGFDGLNVTVPHKRTVIPHLTELSAEAAAIGAVNTLVRGEMGFSGENTDAAGFTEAYLKNASPNLKTLILGAGGAARAIAQAVASKGISAVIAGRNKSAAAELAAAFGHKGAAWADIADLAPLDLVINATSASSPAELGPLAPLPLLSKGAIVIDVNYGRPFNHFQELAAKNGAAFHDGLPMLAHQARGSFRFWTGADPGPGPFLAVLESAARAAQPQSLPMAAQASARVFSPGQGFPARKKADDAAKRDPDIQEPLGQDSLSQNSLSQDALAKDSAGRAPLGSLSKERRS